MGLREANSLSEPDSEEDMVEGEGFEVVGAEEERGKGGGWR